MPLTPRQAEFCRQYLLDLNATQAAVRAGYAARSAHNQAARMMRNDEVLAEIARLQEGRSARTGVTADAVVQQLARVAFFDVRALFRPDGTPKAPHELGDDAAAAVAAVDTTDGRCRVRLHDRLSALELLGKHLGLFRERVELSGPDGRTCPVHIYLPDNGRDPPPDDRILAPARGDDPHAAHPEADPVRG